MRPRPLTDLVVDVYDERDRGGTVVNNVGIVISSDLHEATKPLPAHKHTHKHGLRDNEDNACEQK